MAKTIDKDKYKLSRILYIIEALLEYFIALAVSVTYLPVLGKAIGISEELIAIVEGFVSLGCGFQIFAILLVKQKRVKPIVTIMHIISQICFALIWLVPIFSFSKKTKVVLFMLIMFIAHATHNVINSPKTNWFMALVYDKKRGNFTAIKEIVSLIGGMIFTIVYGGLISYFEGRGEETTAFILCGIIIFFIMVMHTLTLVFSKEKPHEQRENDKHEESLKEQLTYIVKDKTLKRVIVIPIVWAIINAITVPFYAIYQRSTMGLNTGVISIIVACCSIIRAVFSTPFGRYADKHSFSKMLNICFIITIVSLIFEVVSGFMIGKISSIIIVSAFWVCNYISMAGINSGVMNIIYDYVDKDKQMVALAFKASIAGIVSFLTILLFTPFTQYLNGVDIFIFGYKIYAQQILGVIAIGITIFLIFYNKKISQEKK